MRPERTPPQGALPHAPLPMREAQRAPYVVQDSVKPVRTVFPLMNFGHLEFKEMQVDTSGKFGGLGIEITVTDGYLTVVTPIEAQRATDS